MTGHLEAEGMPLEMLVRGQKRGGAKVRGWQGEARLKAREPTVSLGGKPALDHHSPTLPRELHRELISVCAEMPLR